MSARTEKVKHSLCLCSDGRLWPYLPRTEHPLCSEYLRSSFTCSGYPFFLSYFGRTHRTPVTQSKHSPNTLCVQMRDLDSSWPTLNTLCSEYLSNSFRCSGYPFFLSYSGRTHWTPATQPDHILMKKKLSSLSHGILIVLRGDCKLMQNTLCVT